jgi:hypothetical protein
VRFLYLDAGLVNELGHHANFCRAITHELSARAISTLVFAHQELTEKLKRELTARAHFRIYTYGHYDHDPIVAWLKSFEIASRVTLDDLQRIGGLEPGDLVYMNWAWPAQLSALIQWAGRFSPDRMPFMVAEVGADPGLEPKDLNAQQMHATLRDPRVDPRAILYRYATRQMSPGAAHRLRLVAFDRVTSAAFRGLLDIPVATLPMPYVRQTIPRNRSGKRPITVSVLGHQRPEKGFDLMPEIATGLLRDRSDIRILVHNARPEQMSATQDKLRQIAASDSRLILEEAVAGPPLWASLLERSDLVLCPYDPSLYAYSHSSVACESLANAIPLVVPARTALAAQLEDFSGPGTCFETFTPQSIVSAIERLADDFDRYAGLAYAAAAQWAKTRGPGNTVERLLALTASDGAIKSRRSSEARPRFGPSSGGG